jgi:hypothetical protein
MTSAEQAAPTFPFFVGCGRSGTTLLRAMFDARADLAIPDEVAFIIRYARPHYALRYGWPRRFDAAACVDLILADWSFRRWALPEEAARGALTDPAPASFADTIRRLYACAAAARGKPRYADKTPMHVLHLPRLARLFPEARFVHIIRDGRDVALSYQSVTWGPTTAEEAAIRWRGSVRRGRRNGRRLGPGRYREVRYEELVAEPERALRSLCEFLDLEWDDAMLHHHVAAGAVVATTRFPGAHQRLLLPPTRGLRDWRRDMPERDVAGFEAIAGDLLDELGYGRATAPSSVPEQLASRARIVADGVRRAWTQARAGSAVLARGLTGRR